MTRKIASPLILFLIVCIALPAKAWSGSTKVDFSREGDLKLKARKTPAKPTELTVDDLLDQDYIQLGTMSVEQQLEVCKVKKDGKTDCKKIKQGEDSTTVLLERAAKKGTDLVRISKDKSNSNESTHTSICTSWMQVPSSQYYCPPIGGANCYSRTVYSNQCVSYRTEYTGYIRTQSSSGDLYSYEPALAQLKKLTHAAASGNVEMLKQTLESGISVDARSLQGRTALGAAAAAGNTEIVRYLLSRGASVDLGDDLGRTPLMLTAMTRYFEAAGLLLDSGADIDARQKGKGETKGYTPLMFAVRSGDSSMVRKILAAGPNVEIKNGKGQTAEELATDVTKGSDIFAFTEKYGLIKAFTQGAFGFIDKTGKIVIPPQFFDARNFSEGLAAVKIGTAWGFIDKKGVMVVEPQFESQKSYSYPGPFSEGLAAFPGKNGWGYIDAEGRVVIEALFGTGENIFSKGKPFSQGLAMIFDFSNTVFIDRDGRQLNDQTFINAYSYTDDLAAVSLLLGGAGYLDRSGKFAIEPKYERTLPFSEGLAAVRINEKWGFIDKNDTMVIPPQYPDDKKDSGDSPIPFSQGLAGVKIKGKWGFIDRAGKMIINPRYAEANPFRDGRALVRSGKKYGFVDRKGNEAIPIKYQYARDFSDGLAMVKVDRKYGYVDPAGNFVIKPLFDELGGQFSEGLIAVRITRDNMAALK